MYCPKCGKQVDDNAVYCPFCRAQLKSTSSVSSGSPSTADAPMLFTSNYVPGFKIDRVLGLVYGITVRSRGLGGNIIAGLRTIGGGEIKEYTELAHQARQQALDRLSQHAQSLGANAVVSVMFDSTEVSNSMDEIIAFGTAVVISPLSDTQQYVRLS